VLTRAELLERVWGRGYTGQPQVVETYVSYLRRKLHRLGPPLIHTRRGVGYMLRGQDRTRWTWASRIWPGATRTGASRKGPLEPS
jgi:Response regulators consisting of a CheY-like receiver domain and a winged-helix DNA-binding domain